MLKRHGCSRVENLNNDVVELILERLPVESLLKLKYVCKTWNSTIESQFFKERQWIRRRQSRGEDVLFVSIVDYPPPHLSYDEAGKSTIQFGSSVFRTVKFPFLSDAVCISNCDGLLCFTDDVEPNVVINPATGWHTNFPHSRFQPLRLDMLNKGLSNVPYPKLGFGKDKLRGGTYKAVWLYNSTDFGKDDVTTCEVFDFGSSTNAWRYVLPASPYRMLRYREPLYFDGSLYWLSECEETKVLSFNLHTETFEVISQTPFLQKSAPALSLLDNCLCISVEIEPNLLILSLSGNKTWDLIPTSTIIPLAILDKDKLLLRGDGAMNNVRVVVIHDLRTKSFEVLYKPTSCGSCVCYFQSLFTV
ncbi:hypothetical protein CARUB_v10028452mg [Capsella rubella]|uniref:F-box domain-containing protein n=1 Tax=Capsella rubella TaxID=81985 RepID=R0GEE6_9BRAS|nr:hypothetical protein CARUB_v10028452mg [Capsella rubella]